MSQATSFSSGGSGTLSTLTGNVGGAVSPTAGNINVVGSGAVNIVGNPGTSTLTVSVSGQGLVWTAITAASQTIAASNGYISNRAGTITYALPATSSLGDVFEITNINTATGWTISQAAGQSIRLGTSVTTIGVGGSISSTQLGDSIRCVCVVANTTWVVLSAVGNLTIV